MNTEEKTLGGRTAAARRLTDGRRRYAHVMAKPSVNPTRSRGKQGAADAHLKPPLEFSEGAAAKLPGLRLGLSLHYCY